MKKKLLIGLASVVGIFVLIGIIAIVTAPEEEPAQIQPTPPAETTEPVSPPTTPEETINAIIQKELGVSNREGVEKIAGIDIVNAGYGYNIDIHFAIDDNLSESFIKGGAQMDVFDTMKALYTSSIDIQWVDMYGTFSMVDKYGNSSEIEVLHARLGRDAANKINWDNMDRIRLFDILDFLEWHPAFRAIN